MIITVKFDSNWIFSNIDNASMVSRFTALCKKTFSGSVTIQEEQMSQCTLDLSTSAAPQQVEEQLKKLIGSLVKEDASQICQILMNGSTKPESTAQDDGFDANDFLRSVKAMEAIFAGEKSSPSAPPAPEAAPAPQEEQPTQAAAQDAPPPQDPPAPTEETALDRINKRIGSESFKALAKEIHLRAPLIRKKHTEEIFLSEAYLVAADSGSGYTSAMELFGQLLLEEGIFSECKKPHKFTLPSPRSGNAEEEMQRLCRSLEDAMESSRVLSFDISDWQDDTGAAVFKNLLMHIFRHNKRSVIFFHVPYMGKGALEQLRKELSDIISTRLLPLEPFTSLELRALAADHLRHSDYEMSEEAWDAYDSLMDEEKRNGLFYGIHTVQKVANEIIRTMELHCAQSGELASQIPLSVVSSLLPAAVPAEDAGMEQLRNMVGIEEIAGRVQEIINQIIFARNNALETSPAMHMCFVGNPGTGKTTVARVIGKALKDAGILRIGNFYEHHGRDFCGKYVGHTAPLTKSICEKAYGSILFVDEAYSLAAGGERDFGQEAIDTLIAEMENHKDDLIVIFAGYPEDIGYLLDTNSGMRSRVPYTLSFPNYTPDQLAQIYLQMASKHFTLGEGFAARAEAYFASIPDSVLESRSFGNARFVRNLYERTWSKAAMRDSAVAIADLVLTVADFDAAAAEFPMEDSVTFKKNPVGFAL